MEKGAGEASSLIQEEEAPKTPAVIEGSISTVETLPAGELTVPDYLQGEETASFSVTEKGEASTTYQLDGQERTDAVNQLATQLQDSLNLILADKEFYPHLTGISTSEDGSEFTLTFSDRELTVYETTLQMSLYITGNKLQLYRGIPEADLLTVVHYVDSSTGEVFFTGSSKDMQ